MLRIHFLQHWFNLSDPAVEEALYESVSMREFVGIDLGREPAPDEITICKFHHLLLLHGKETAVWGDSAYTGQTRVIEEHAPWAADLTQRRGRGYKYLGQMQRAINRRRSKVRARVEHAIGVIKRVFGFTKVRYRGLAKNGNRLFVAAALANLYMVRRPLLDAARA
jgi:IS5 family transposase